jgi:auxin responsive GH3 gene family
MLLELLSKDLHENLLELADSFFPLLIPGLGEIGENIFLSSLDFLSPFALGNLKCNTIRSAEVQTNLLMEILSLQRNTDYCKNHNFSNIQSVDAFRQICPLSSYEDYRSIIDNIARTNNFTELVAEPITLLQETAGTTGKTKLIPRTNRLSMSMLTSVSASNAVLNSYYFKNKEAKKRRSLPLLNIPPVKRTPSGIMQGTGTSGGFSQSFEKYNFFQEYIRLKYSSPSSVFFIPNYESSYYCHLLFGLLDEELALISANFASNVLEAIRILEKDWTQIVRDIELGQINENIYLEASIRNELKRLLKPNPKRAKQLEIEFEKGMQAILPRIWNQMSCILCITSGSMQVYHDNLKYYAGKIPFYSAGYAASEAWIGVNLDPLKEPPTYVITPHSAFFEFIEIEQIDVDNPDTVTLTSVEVGKSYEIVVTTVAGLYRYRLGDIVKCTGFYNQSPIIEFLYRRGSLLDIAGEKVSESTIFTALTEAVALLGHDCKISDYTSRIEFSTYPPKYVIYVEISKLFEILPDIKACRIKIEQVIFDFNELYKKSRDTGVIAPLELNLVQPDSFQELKKIVFCQTSESQFKMPRLIKSSEAIDFLENKVLIKEK